MIRKDIRVVNAYFGKLPDYFPLWLESAKWNRGYHWILITDQSSAPYALGDNVTWRRTDFESFKRLLGKNLDVDASEITPYKLCDFKPTYGLALQEELQGADFWGFCDIDLVFGNLDHFITDDDLDRYDRFFAPGHFQLYRNNERINSLFLEPVLDLKWRDAIKHPRSTQYSEFGGIHPITQALGIPYRLEKRIADIRPEVRRCRAHDIRNYREQLFVYEHGGAFQYFRRGGRWESLELMYIHFQKRRLRIPDRLARHPEDIQNGIIVGSEEFAFLPESESRLLEAVKNYNAAGGQDEREFLRSLWMRRIKRLPKAMANRAVARRRARA